jgi:hypothetical protein
MKKTGKTGIVALVLVFLVSLQAFPQNKTMSGLQKSASKFSDAMVESLPFNASLGLNWSDAYIGKIFPGAPPHFGIGVSAGFTTIDMSAAEDLAKNLGFGIDLDMAKLPLPAYAAEGRIGGFFLPFDIGFKYGYLPPVGLLGTGVDMNYTMVGGDIRYAITEGGVIMPVISVGVGLNYLSGGIGTKVGGAQSYTFDNGAKTLNINAPEVDLMWKTLALDFKVQASKTFFILTPYLGLGATYAWSEAGYEAKGTITGDLSDAKADSTFKDIDFNGTKKMSSITEESGFGIRAFGGLSLKLAVIKLDLTGLYNFMDGNYGASFGVRFQL